MYECQKISAISKRQKFKTKIFVPQNKIMKILCETSILNRLHQSNVRSKQQKSTLALVEHKPLKENQPELSLILFTAQNKTGQKYRLADGNLKQVFTKFVHEGKITISLKVPEIDIFVKSECVQLKLFLKTLKCALDGNPNGQKIGLSNISVTSIPVSKHPQKKLVIKARGDYPIKGFARTLESLVINGIQRHRFEGQILFLKNLVHLDLSDNCISSIPKSLGDMNIKEIYLGNNKIGASEDVAPWKWMDGAGLKNSLQILDLSGNTIKKIPFELMNLKNLVTLKLTTNEIEFLPFSISRLKKLRNLHMSKNLLKTLPSTIRGNHLEVLDISDNLFSATQMQPFIKSEQLVYPPDYIKLWKFAAQIIATRNIPLAPHIVPKSVIELIDRTPQCNCGKFCFQNTILPQSCVMSFPNVKQLVKDNYLMIVGDRILCATCYKNLKKSW